MGGDIRTIVPSSMGYTAHSFNGYSIVGMRIYDNMNSNERVGLYRYLGKNAEIIQEDANKRIEHIEQCRKTIMENLTGKQLEMDFMEDVEYVSPIPNIKLH